MSGKKLSVIGKKHGEDEMSIALSEARHWAGELEKRERYLTDGTRESARYSVSRKTGVPFSYLSRLRHKWREMNGVDGDAYRNLFIAYQNFCERIEASADHEAQLLKELQNGNSSGARSGEAGDQ